MRRSMAAARLQVLVVADDDVDRVLPRVPDFAGVELRRHQRAPRHRERAALIIAPSFALFRGGGSSCGFYRPEPTPLNGRPASAAGFDVRSGPSACGRLAGGPPARSGPAVFPARSGSPAGRGAFGARAGDLRAAVRAAHWRSPAPRARSSPAAARPPSRSSASRSRRRPAPRRFLVPAPASDGRGVSRVFAGGPGPCRPGPSPPSPPTRVPSP